MRFPQEWLALLIRISGFELPSDFGPALRDHSDFRALAALAAMVVLLAAGCSKTSEQETTGAAAMVIVPNLSVGDVRAGMTTQQVVATLGEPQRRTASALEYTHLGLAVMPGPDGMAAVVMCGDVTGINGPFVKAFTGRTKEGIGMYSTRENVVKAYGEPTESEKMLGALESLKYDGLGMTFTLEGGKVHHIIVRLRGKQEPDHSVTIEPAPK